MKKSDRNLLIGAALVGGYLWYTRRPAAAAPAPSSGFFSSITGALKSVLSPGTVTLGQPTQQNILPRKPATPFTCDENVTVVLEGYYGSLGGCDKGSLGGGLRALRGGKYGSLG